MYGSSSRWEKNLDKNESKKCRLSDSSKEISMKGRKEGNKKERKKVSKKGRKKEREEIRKKERKKERK